MVSLEQKFRYLAQRLSSHDVKTTQKDTGTYSKTRDERPLPMPHTNDLSNEVVSFGGGGANLQCDKQKYIKANVQNESVVLALVL